MSDKLLVVVHVFYPQLWGQLEKCISNLDKLNKDYDLYVTIPANLKDFSKIICRANDKAKIIVSENLGYDIWPFIDVLNNINLDNYDYVIKLHTKRSKGFDVSSIRNKYYFMGSTWRDLLISFIKSKRNLELSFSAFEHDPLLGMVNSGKLIEKNEISEDNAHYSFCARKAIELINKFCNYNSNSIEFIAGSMFMSRAFLLKPLQNLKLKANDFTVVNRSKENDFAHVMERVFGGLVLAQGYKISDPFSSLVDNILFYPYSQLCRFLTIRFIRKIIRFIFRIDGSYGEDKIIRIFKINVLKLKNKDNNFR